MYARPNAKTRLVRSSYRADDQMIGSSGVAGVSPAKNGCRGVDTISRIWLMATRNSPRTSVRARHVASGWRIRRTAGIRKTDTDGTTWMA